MTIVWCTVRYYTSQHQAGYSYGVGQGGEKLKTRLLIIVC